jgi:hypothetical protein
MNHDAEEDLEAQRLADYSDAVKRGKARDAEGIDPLDAAIIRRLNALGKSAPSSPRYLGRRKDPFRLVEQLGRDDSDEADLSQQVAPSYNPLQENYANRLRVLPSDATSEPDLIDLTKQSRFNRAWRSKSAIAAGLALLIATMALAVLLAIYLDNGSETPAVSSTSTFVPTSVPDLTSTTVANIAASPNPDDTKSIEVFGKFTEPSSVGLGTPTFDAFRTRTFNITWDGKGTIMLSGCPDQLCNYVLDDELILEVKNPERTEALVWVTDNGTEDGESRGLPLYLTNLFRSGNNSVTATLTDRAGNQRGARTPIYIIIFH